MVSLWAFMLHEQWFHGNSDVHGETTKTTKNSAQAVKYPSQYLQSIIKWTRNGQPNCLLNYLQYSNVTLLEMFVLSTDCLNFDSVSAAYNFIFEKLPAVCKYKENVDACSYSVLQLSSGIFQGGMLHMREFKDPMRWGQVFTHFLAE